MKTYTEEDLRKAFQAGADYGRWYVNPSFEEPMSEDEYIESLNPKVEEKTISFTYSFLRQKLDWFEFCELTGTNEWALREGFEIKDNDIFYITESKAKEFNLI